LEGIVVITKEHLLGRRLSLANQVDRAKAQVAALEGAIEVLDYLLADLEAPEPVAPALPTLKLVDPPKEQA
jgi:hypothetical protein